MEMVDVLNKNGVLTGITATKQEVHDKGYWHGSVHIWLINKKNEILIQIKSKLVRGSPSNYDISAAGHLTAGESPEQGAMREFQEELGINLSIEDLIWLGKIRQEGYRTKYTNKEWVDIFVVHKEIKLKEFKIDQKEVKGLKYINLQEFKAWLETTMTNKLIVHPKEFNFLFKHINYNRVLGRKTPTTRLSGQAHLHVSKI